MKKKQPKMKNIALPHPSEERNRVDEYGQGNQIDFAKFVHDIKGPLNSMKGLLKVAKMDVNNEIAKHYLNLLERCQEQLDLRIRKSLDHFNNGSYSVVEIDFKKLINEIKSSLENVDGYSQTEFNVLVSNKKPFYSDYEAVYSIFQNIIENAIKYRKDDANVNTINIVLLDSPDGIHVKIADNGKGIKSDLIPSIFNMNVKGSDHLDTDSHGIGLAIVKQLITRLNGKISLDTKYGVGTTFDIELPNALGEDHS